MFVQFDIQGEKVVKRDTQCFSHHWTHGVPKKKNVVMISRTPEKFTTKQDGSTLKTLFIGVFLGEHEGKA